MVKTLDTLVSDIYSLFDPEVNHEVSEENLDHFAETVKNVLRDSLKSREIPNEPLRFSGLGKQDRQVWYAANNYPQEEMRPNTYVKFLYGHLIEAMILFLAREAGHTVEREQEEIDVLGVKGHIDAVVDGVVVDVKSAAPYGFKKFELGELKPEEDSFGYLQQLGGYGNVLSPSQGAAFIAVDKVGGDICVSPVSPKTVEKYPPAERIEHLREVIASPEPPERCYEDVADGKSGNRKLPTPCSYCAYKKDCWPGVRKFLYSGGPRYLTVVDREPDVPEAFN